jgi:hypothetical protein
LGLFLLFTAALGGRGKAADQPDAVVNAARVQSVAADQTSIDIASYVQASPQHVLVQDPALKGEVKDLQAGDQVSLTVDGSGTNAVLKAVSVKSVGVTWPWRAGALVVLAVLLLILLLIFTVGHPLKTMVGKDKRYSNSQFQAAIWFGIVIVIYVAAVLLRWWFLGADFLSVSIPPHLLLLSGLSALTYGGAAAITAGKVQNGRAAGVVDPKPANTNPPSFVSDLTSNDSGQFDFGDFQSVIITIIAFVTYLAIAFHFLGLLEYRTTVTLPDVDTTILALFGLGQGAYLTKKSTGPPGKV